MLEAIHIQNIGEFKTPEDKVIKSFLHPLTSWRRIPFSQTQVMWAEFLCGRREDYGTDGRQ